MRALYVGVSSVLVYAFVACGNDGSPGETAGGGGSSGDTTGGAGASSDGSAGGKGGADSGSTGGASTGVLQHHNNASRDGVYVDAALTKAAVATLHVDTTFSTGTFTGPTTAQPLYLAGAAGKPDLVIVATNQNHVYGFDASNGMKVWDQALGTPLPKSRLAGLKNSSCGNVDPIGVTGTPVIDAATRTIYLDAMIAGATAQHQVFALDADTGMTRAGWPVDLNATAKFGSTAFSSLAHNQRGALALVGGRVFVPFGGHIGDCGEYHGWVVGITTTDPTQVSGWATRAIAGGIWAPSGIASDGTSIFVATGNTQASVNQFTAPSTFGDGEALVKLPPTLAYSAQNGEYFAPSDWAALDNADRDIGGTGPILVDVPGATPSSLVIGLGKDGKAYLVDRTRMGGVGAAATVTTVSSNVIINAAASYRTAMGTYVVFRAPGSGCPSGQSGALTAFKIAATSPPTISVAWCSGPATNRSPAVTMTDAEGSNALVWIVGNDYKLRALDGDTGQVFFAGGPAADTMSAVSPFQTPIAIGGRLFVAANTQAYAFRP